LKKFLFWFAVAERRQAETHLIILDFVQKKLEFQPKGTANLRFCEVALRAKKAEFETICHAPRGEKEMFWFWIWKFEPIFFRKSRIPSGFSLEAIILACLLSFMNLSASSNRLLLFSSKAFNLSFKTCF